VDPKNPNFSLGLSMIAIGVALMSTIDPWFAGLPFLIIGLTRLAAARTAPTEEFEAE